MPVIYVLFTGGFDPVHSGHINCMKQAATLGNLVVAPNSDRWLAKKKGAAFQPLNERVAILENFKFVHSVLTNWDDQDGSAKNAIYDFYKGNFQLEGLQYWRELDGRNYANLPEQVRRGIDRRYLSSIVLLQETAKSEEEAE